MWGEGKVLVRHEWGGQKESSARGGRWKKLHLHPYCCSSRSSINIWTQLPNWLLDIMWSKLEQYCGCRCYFILQPSPCMWLALCACLVLAPVPLKNIKNSASSVGYKLSEYTLCWIYSDFGLVIQYHLKFLGIWFNSEPWELDSFRRRPLLTVNSIKHEIWTIPF